MNERSARIALIGQPNAGKTSFLATLYGVRHGTLPTGITWTVLANAESRAYLRNAWDRIRNGEPMFATNPAVAHPHIQLTLQRSGASRGNDRRFTLDVLDMAGEFTRERTTRAGPIWQDVAQRIAGAEVLLLILDAMNALHTHGRADQQIQNLINNLLDLLEDAASAAKKPYDETVRRKLLGVCFSKCDTLNTTPLNGRLGPGGAINQLVDAILPDRQRVALDEAFRSVEYFGLSILRDWRWSRDGSCVRVGQAAVEPVGIFEPFEWIATQRKLQV
jgi:GTPase SAR1 family protein